MLEVKGNAKRPSALQGISFAARVAVSIVAVVVSADSFRVEDTREASDGEEVVDRYVDAAVAYAGVVKQRIGYRVTELHVFASQVSCTLQVASLVNLVFSATDDWTRIVSVRIVFRPVVEVFFEHGRLPDVGRSAPEIGV
jgi:hypothetical protein